MTSFQEFLLTDRGKTFIAARDNWIENFGRKESGALIGKGEYKKWNKIYFPQPNDPPEIKAMKKQARESVELAYGISAGRGEQVAAQKAAELKTD